MARSFWVAAAGVGEIRTEVIPAPGPGEIQVRSLFSAVSRGTETLVFRGEVPPNQYPIMRAPFQAGDFPAPVKYGYLNVGQVVAAPDPDDAELLGRTVFCLHPHQTEYVVPAGAVVGVPAGVPARRAVLAGTVETAVNAAWDAAPLIGDRITVVGAGMVGCCVARVLAGIPGTEVELVDVDESRAEVAAALGVRFATTRSAAAQRDLVVHASASAAGLSLALGLVRTEGTVLELSWYGDREIGVRLGESFHSGRLTLRASQVGRIAPARRDTRTYADRLGLALELLRDPAYDALITGESAFEELPTVLAELAAGRPALAHLIRY